MNINVASGNSQCLKPLRAKPWDQTLRTLKHKVHPKPRKASKRHLKTAGPVHANGIWILAMPALPLPEQFRNKLLVAAKTVRFGQGDQMLVPVQLPCNFAVADFCEIQVPDFVPHLSRGLLAMDAIAVPINFPTVIQILVTEQIEAMLAD